MTYEECQKALEEGTWLTQGGEGLGLEVEKILVRVVDISDEFSSWCSVKVRSPEYGVIHVAAAELEIATPNDMLKYGE